MKTFEPKVWLFFENIKSEKSFDHPITCDPDYPSGHNLQCNGQIKAFDIHPGEFPHESEVWKS